MKLKYIFASIVAALTLVGCQKEADHYLDEIKVSSSYVALSTGVGANTSITVTATDSWYVSVDEKTAKWLTVSPTMGGAGETNLTFSASAGEGRTAEIQIRCGEKTQRINVIQGVATISNATCAEVIAGPDSKTYRVSGVCTSIANTTYGNWYLNDGTGEVYIYGTLDKNGGTKNFLSLGIEVGDEITVEGPKTTYNGTVELVDVTVVKINKSLMKVEEVKYINEDPEVTDCLDVPGGYVSFLLSNKGNGLYVDVPSDAAGWLSINSVAGDVVIFSATANEGGDRETDVTFRTVSGGKDYTATATIKQKGAIIACTVAEFLAAEVGNTQYRLTGVISRDYPSDKQGQSFYIKDWSGETLVYRVDNFKESGLQVGDVVTVRGKRGAYKDSPQMVNGTIEAVVEIVDEATIPEVLAAADGAWFRVTGEVKSIANETYGNIYITDGTNELYIYGCYPGYGATGDARKGVVAAEGIKEGDMLTVFGPKSTYKGTPQINGGIFWSLTPAN